ncbi:RagB/SusD family nutrient uptake outer membrane protein [Chitinophaga rhizophila]|uniref:RagB/SusD family nutrient uptake outer membrane protein n=1 Tax=Chitinophaga rhizophila TaxID=2866212 RepID=A0ABS7GLR5_9BACT|nr:RagB/SusD family nutrient uptake outer membrane protein [Chitinophaga rhizophila]MBW8688160.1 RagB/SusD family nutrient uptake outer membrane protein [Chitinophaga rhizophila]
MSKYIFFLLLIALLIPGCRKFLEIGNPTIEIVADKVYNSNTSAAAVLTGMYYTIGRDGSFGDGQGGISFRCALYGDELAALVPVYHFTDEYQNAKSPDFWANLFGLIYRANAAVVGLNKSNTLSPDIKKQLLGEAKFLRAFCYFYLTNFYGDVPLLLEPEYRITSSASRSEEYLVYKQIVQDLIESKSLLSTRFLAADIISETEERVRPTKWAAAALLSRVYLYRKEWRSAELEADTILGNLMFDTVSVHNVFIKNNREAIWQIQPVDDRNGFLNTADARIFVLNNGVNSQNPVWLGENVMKAFEEDDLRCKYWIKYTANDAFKKYPYPFKYKSYDRSDISKEYISVLRLAEVYLIRAEARAETGNIVGGKEDLNIIRRRAGIRLAETLTKKALLDAIMHERQIEFFTEWGHRWLDLKRRGNLSKVMEIYVPLKGGIWVAYKALFSLPLEDIRLNPNLVQNEGYPSY